MSNRTIRSIVIWAITIFICFIIFWPVYWIVISSFATPEDLFAMPVNYSPFGRTLENYRILLDRATDTIAHFTDTAKLLAATLVVSTILCALAGYAFARSTSRGIKLAFGALLFSMMIPGTMTVVPLLVLWRWLGLTDTLSGLTLLYLSMLIPFSVIMFSAYIRQIPASLEEAAWIDGSGIIGTFFRIIFPLLKPIVATLCIINFINGINEFFTPLVFTTRNVRVLSQLVFNVPRVNVWQEPWATIAASGVLMIAPTVLFILLFEKNIMSGLMMGSVKQ